MTKQQIKQILEKHRTTEQLDSFEGNCFAEEVIDTYLADVYKELDSLVE